MMKIVSMCAALVLAAAAFSAPALAQKGGHFGGPGKMSFGGPGRIGTYGGGVYGGGKYTSGYGHGYRYPHRRYGGWYGGYWPWGLGAGLALAATWPYYGGYDYGYDDCVQWRPDWGWVNVCEYPYGGYYPY